MGARFLPTTFILELESKILGGKSFPQLWGMEKETNRGERGRVLKIKTSKIISLTVY